MPVVVTQSEFVLPGEAWTVYDTSDDLVALFAKHALEMQRACLFTLSPDYMCVRAA